MLTDLVANPGQRINEMARNLGKRVAARPDAAIEEIPLLTAMENNPQAPAFRQRDDVGIIRAHYDYNDQDRLSGIAYQLAWLEHVDDPHDIKSWEAAAFWRYVSFQELLYLPVDEREDPDIMGRTHILNRGLANADVPLIYLASGVFTPEELGVLQIYGSAGEAWDYDEAMRQARYGVDTLASLLHSAFPHAKMDALDRVRVNLVMAQLRERPELAICMGYPDPRATKKGMGHEQDGSISQSAASQEELASQQGEYLLRALQKLRANFLLAVSAAAVNPIRLAAGLMGTARLTSDYASRQRGSISSGMSVGVPFGGAMNAGVTGGVGGNMGENINLGQAWNEGWNEGQNTGWNEGVSEGESYGVNEGGSEGLNAGENINAGVNRGLNVGQNAGVNENYSENRGENVGENWGANWGRNQSAGRSENVGENFGVNEGWNEGENWGRNTGGGTNRSEGVNRSWSEGVSEGRSEGASVGRSAGENISEGAGANTGISRGSTASAGAQVGATVNMGGSGNYSEGQSDNVGYGANEGVNEGRNTGENWGRNAGRSGGTNESAGENTSWGASEGASQGRSGGTSRGVSRGESTSWNEGSSQGGSHGVSAGRSAGESRSQGVSRGDSAGQSYGESRGAGRSTGENIGRSWGENYGRNVGYSQGRSGGESSGQSGGQSANVGRGVSSGSNINLGQSLGTSMNAGLAPAFNLGRNWNTEDDSAIHLTQILRQVEGVINEGTIQGAHVTSVTLLTDPEHMKPAIAAAQMAWHGASTPMTMECYHISESDPYTAARIRNLAQCFMPAIEGGAIQDDPTASGLVRHNSTVLTSSQLAAYVAPNLFEHGRLQSTQQRRPATAFYAPMEGDVLLGHFISPEDGSLTKAPVRMDRKRHFHTMVLGDTGFGKTVLMERLVYETTLKWHMRSIVFDFGAGWRKLANAPGLEGRVDVRQLTAGGSRPLRWNPLQVGRRLAPEVHWKRFCEVFAATSGMGAARQMPEMRAMLWGVYVRSGVLVDDPLVLERDEKSTQELWGGEIVNTEEDAAHYGVKVGDPVPYQNVRWWKLDSAEEVAIARRAWDAELARGYVPSEAETEAFVRIAEPDFPIASLPREVRQAIGRHRSRKVGPQELMKAARQRIEHPGISSDLQGYLQGITTRLNSLVQGQAAEMFCAGDDVPDICEIVPGNWGVCVLEGGAVMDEAGKAFLMGWAGWQIYQDCVIDRIQTGETKPAGLQLIFEEANKIFGGGAGSAEDGSQQSGPSTSEQFESMFRDSRKYGIFLHTVAQNPSQLPEGIVSSSNNLASTQLKNRKDQEIVITHMHRSSKGFQDEEWSRYLGSIPIAETIFKMGYTDERMYMEPMCMKPAMLDLPEPSDAELATLTIQA